MVAFERTVAFSELLFFRITSTSLQKDEALFLVESVTLFLVHSVTAQHHSLLVCRGNRSQYNVRGSADSIPWDTVRRTFPNYWDAQSSVVDRITTQNSCTLASVVDKRWRSREYINGLTFAETVLMCDEECSALLAP